MQEERLKILLEYYNEDPNDPFNAYALALAYLNIDKEESKKYFDRLLVGLPDYLPTYYHAAAFYFEIGDIEKAKNIYEKGIEKAHQKQPNSKTYDELKRAYVMFLDEIDE